MRNAFVIAGIFALTTALSSSATLAQSSGMGGAGMAAGSASGAASAQADSDFISVRSNMNASRSLARADISAGTHGLKGRHVARTHGANKTGFCPPGQAKKPGSGSHFQC